MRISPLAISLSILLVLGAVLEHASAEETTDSGVAAFRHAVGEDDWQMLQTRLVSLNQDISDKGILPFPGTSDKLLTGYASHQFYD